MVMKTLREVIETAEKEKTAIGHFNISTIEVLWSIFDAARELNVPIIIGASEGERKFIGVKQSVALVRSLREEFDYPIFLNADHTYSFDGIKKAIDAGYDAVIFDGTKLSFEENINITKRSVEYAQSVNPDVLVEGELGYIGESSKLLDEIPKGVDIANMTTPDDARRFVEETGVHLLAPSVGNIHGMLRHAQNPNLDSSRITQLRESAGVPLVLHGGSGITNENFTQAIDAGISIIHINTEIRKVWRDTLELSLQDDRDAIAPYKILKNARESVRKSVLGRLELFSKK